MNAYAAAIGTRLARLGRTRAWLAEKIGVSRPTVTNHLKAEAISADFLRRAAKALGVGRKALDALAEQEYQLALTEKRRMTPPLVNGPHKPQ